MKHKKITVIYIITKLELGGAQKVCLSLCSGMPEHAIETILISGTQGPLVAQAQQLPNTILLKSLTREIGIFSIFNEIRIFFNLIFLLKRLARTHKDVIIHTHSTKAGLVGRWAAFFARIPHRVHTVHGYAFHQHQSWLVWLPIYLLELLTSFVTTHFVCVSATDAHTGSRLFPRFAKKHSIIRAAVDWEQFYQPARKATHFPASAEPFIFGTVACFKQQKNLFDMLQAFAHVHAKNAATRLEIIGDGQLRFAIEQWIAHHNLQDVVTLHGWQEKVAPIMSTWHAFVLSSLWEGLPCAVVEARLLNIPVLSYKTGGIPEIIAHGKNGFLYEQKNWRALADGMYELTQHAHVYEKLRAHPENLHDFNDKNMVMHHAKLYEELVG